MKNTRRERLMKIAKLTAIGILAAFMLISCSSISPLSEEEAAMLVEGTVFEPDETEKTVYVPVETVRYVITNDDNSDRIENDNATIIPEEATSGDYLNSSVDSNTVSVGSETDFTNAIVEYNFLDGKIYEIFTSPNKVTDIRLAPGETISGEAAIGDSESWQMVTASSSEKGRAVTHIYVRPVTSGLETTMIIPTDQRTYYLLLTSTEDVYMVGVRWKYPGIATFGASADSIPSVSISVENMNSNYTIKGDNVFWKPTMVFDDGLRTYFQFDPRFSTSAGAPALYLLPREGSNTSKAEIINYVIRGNFYIADFVLQDRQSFMLMTQDNRVEITKK